MIIKCHSLGEVTCHPKVKVGVPFTLSLKMGKRRKLGKCTLLGVQVHEFEDFGFPECSITYSVKFKGQVFKV